MPKSLLSLHQRKLTEAIKRARNIALLPFSASHSKLG